MEKGFINRSFVLQPRQNAGSRRHFAAGEGQTFKSSDDRPQAAVDSKPRLERLQSLLHSPRVPPDGGYTATSELSSKKLRHAKKKEDSTDGQESVVTKVEESSRMEETFRSALTHYFAQVDKEKEEISDDLRKLQNDVRHYLEDGKKFFLDNKQKTLVIKKLTENGKLLVQEIENLKEVNNTLQKDKVELIKEINEIQKKLQLEHEEVPRLENEMRVLMEENQYLKLLAEDTKRLTDQENEIRNLENQVKYLDGLCKQHASEISRRDRDVKDLVRQRDELKLNMKDLSKLKQAEAELKSLRDQHEALHADHKSLIIEKQGDADELRNLKEALRKMESQVSSYRSREDTWQSKLDQLKSANVEEEQICSKLRQKVEELERVHSADSEELRSQGKLVRDLTEENSALEKKILGLEEDLDFANSQLKKSERSTEALQRDVERYRTRSRELETQCSDLKAKEQLSKTHVLELKSKLEAANTSEGVFKERIRCLQNDLQDVREALGKMELKVERGDAREKELESEILNHVKKSSMMEQEITMKNESISRGERNLERCEEQRSRLQKDLMACQDKIRDLEITSEHRMYEADVSNEQAEESIRQLRGSEGRCVEFEQENKRLLLKNDELLLSLEKLECRCRFLEEKSIEDEKQRRDSQHQLNLAQETILKLKLSLNEIEELQCKFDACDGQRIRLQREVLQLRTALREGSQKRPPPHSPPPVCSGDEEGELSNGMMRSAGRCCQCQHEWDVDLKLELLASSSKPTDPTNGFMINASSESQNSPMDGKGEPREVLSKLLVQVEDLKLAKEHLTRQLDDRVHEVRQFEERFVEAQKVVERKTALVNDLQDQIRQLQCEIQWTNGSVVDCKNRVATLPSPKRHSLKLPTPKSKQSSALPLLPYEENASMHPEAMEEEVWRKSTCREWTSVAEIDEVENLNKLVANLRRELLEKEMESKIKDEELQAAKRNHQRTVGSPRERILDSDYDRQRQRIKDLHGELLKKSSECLENEEEKKNLKRKLDRSEDALRDTTNKNDELAREIAKHLEIIRNIQEKLNASEIKENQLQSDLNRLKADLSVTEKACDSLKKEKEGLDLECDRKENTIRNLESYLEKLTMAGKMNEEHASSEIDRWKGELKVVEGHCDRLRKNIDELHSELEMKNKTIRSLREELLGNQEATASDQEELKKRSAEVERLRADHQKLQSVCQNLSKSASEHEKTDADKTAQLEMMLQDLNASFDIQKKYEGLETQLRAEVSRLRQEIQETKEKLDKSRTDLSRKQSEVEERDRGVKLIQDELDNTLHEFAKSRKSETLALQENESLRRKNNDLQVGKNAAEEEIEVLRRELEEALENLHSIKESNERTTRENWKMTEQKNTLEKEIAQVTNELKDIKYDSDMKVTRINQLQSEIFTYKEAEVRLRDALSDALDTKKIHEGRAMTVETLSERLKSEIASMQLTIHAKDQQFSSLQSEIAKITSENDRLKVEYRQLEKDHQEMKKTLSRVQSELDEKKRKLLNAEKQESEAKQAVELSAKKLRETEAQLDSIERQRKSLEQEKRTLEQTMSDVQTNERELRARWSDERMVRDHAEKQAAKALSRNGELEALNENLRTENEKLTEANRNLNQDLQTCQKDMSKAVTEQEAMQERLRSQELCLEELKQQLNEKRNQVEEANHRERLNEFRVRELENENQRIQVLITRTEKELENANGRILQLDQMLEDQDNVERDLKQQRLSTEERIQKITGDLDGCRLRANRLEQEKQETEQRLNKAISSQRENADERDKLSVEVKNLRLQLSEIKIELEAKTRKNVDLQSELQVKTRNLLSREESYLIENERLRLLNEEADQKIAEFEALASQGKLDFNEAENLMEKQQRENEKLGWKILEMQRKSEADADAVRRSLKVCQEEKTDLEKEIDRERQHVEFLNSERATLEDQVREEKRKHEELQSRLLLQEGEILRLKEECLNEKKGNQDLYRSVSLLQAELMEETMKNECLEREKEDKDSEIFELNNCIEVLEKRSFNLSIENEDVNAKTKETEKMLVEYRIKCNNYKERLELTDKDMNQLNNEIKRLTQLLDDEKQARRQEEEEYTAKLSKMQIELSSNENRTRKSGKNLDGKENELQVALEKTAAQQQRIRRLEDDIAKEKLKKLEMSNHLQNKVREIEQEHSRETSQLRATLQAMEETRGQDFTLLKTKIREAESLHQQLMKDKQELGVRKREFDDLQEEASAVRDRLKEYMWRKEELEKEMQYLKEQVRNLEKIKLSGDENQEKIFDDLKEKSRRIHQLEQEKDAVIVERDKLITNFESSKISHEQDMDEKDFEIEKLMMELRSVRNQLKVLESAKEEKLKVEDELGAIKKERDLLQNKIHNMEDMKAELREYKLKADTNQNLLSKNKTLKQLLQESETRSSESVDKLIIERNHWKRKYDEQVERSRDLEEKMRNLHKPLSSSSIYLEPKSPRLDPVSLTIRQKSASMENINEFPEKMTPQRDLSSPNNKPSESFRSSFYSRARSVESLSTIADEQELDFPHTLPRRNSRQASLSSRADEDAKEFNKQQLVGKLTFKRDARSGSLQHLATDNYGSPTKIAPTFDITAAEAMTQRQSDDESEEIRMSIKSNPFIQLDQKTQGKPWKASIKTTQEGQSLKKLQDLPSESGNTLAQKSRIRVGSFPKAKKAISTETLFVETESGNNEATEEQRSASGNVQKLLASFEGRKR